MLQSQARFGRVFCKQMNVAIGRFQKFKPVTINHTGRRAILLSRD